MDDRTLGYFHSHSGDKHVAGRRLMTLAWAFIFAGFLFWIGTVLAARWWASEGTIFGIVPATLLVVALALCLIGLILIAMASK